MITRFAPSPTGLLHLGHAASALAGWQRARAAGQFLLRIEDIDAGRCRETFVTALVEDLRWLGLHWHAPVRRQSAHMDAYAAVLGRLRGMGLLYPCFCTRGDVVREVAAAGGAPHRAPDGAVIYPGTCRGLGEAERAARVAAGEGHAWRLDMAGAVARVGALTFHEEGAGRVACAPLAFGDVVLGRRDMPASYHLCVAHDDAVQGVTLVTRGVDLIAATAVHRVLQALLGWEEPGYAHHPLVLGADGRRLAKRDGPMSLRALREAGWTAERALDACATR